MGHLQALERIFTARVAVGRGFQLPQLGVQRAEASVEAQAHKAVPEDLAQGMVALLGCAQGLAILSLGSRIVRVTIRLSSRAERREHRYREIFEDEARAGRRPLPRQGALEQRRDLVPRPASIRRAIDPDHEHLERPAAVEVRLKKWDDAPDVISIEVTRD